MKKLILILGVLFGFHLSAFALEERSLNRSFQDLALPYFQSAQEEAFTGKDGIQIHYRVFEGNQPVKGNLVMVNGFTEFMMNYAELAYDLRNSGYRLFLYDHRGQGSSERMIPDSLKGYVLHFQDYVDDLGTFIDEVVAKKYPAKTFIFTHSMGGAIGTEYVIQNPGKVAAIVESSPMYRANLGGFPRGVALAIADGAIAIGKGTDYAIGRGPKDWNKPFEKNQVTSSESRWSYILDEERENMEYVVSAPTYFWVRECILSSFWLETNIQKLVTPTLILTAGADQIVFSKPEIDLCAKSSACESQLYPDAQHSLFLERDEIRNLAISDMLRYFDQH